MFTDNIQNQLAENLEAIECQVWEDILHSTGNENAKKLGVSYKKFKNVSISVLSSFDILAFNRVIYCNSNSGLNSPLNEIIDEYKRNKIPRFFFSINPDFLTGELKEDLIKHGFVF